MTRNAANRLWPEGWRLKRLRNTSAALVSLFFASCGLSSGSSTRAFFYVAYPSRGELNVFTLSSSNAKLVAADPSSVTVASQPGAVAGSANGAFVVVASQNASTLTLYSVNSTTGQLTATDLKVTGATPTHVVADGNNRYFYVANQGSGTISAYSLNTTAQTLTVIGTISASAGVTRLALSANSRFLYAASPVSDAIDTYSISGSGTLTAVGTTTLTGVYSVVAHPTLDFAFATSSTAGTLTPYAIDSSTGALSPLTSVNVGGTANGIVVEPVSGTQVLVAVSSGTTTAGTLRTYSLNSTTGALEHQANYTVGTQPTNLLIDSVGQSVMVQNATSGSLSVFARATQTGTLTETLASPLSLGSGAGTCVLVRR